MKDIEQAFIDAGQKAIVTWLVSKLPWLGGWFMSPITGFFAGLAAQFIISELDKMAFAVYVAAAVGGQVSDFIKAEESGDTTAIDNAADGLIHLGKT